MVLCNTLECGGALQAVPPRPIIVCVGGAAFPQSAACRRQRPPIRVSAPHLRYRIAVDHAAIQYIVSCRSFNSQASMQQVSEH